MNRVHLITVVLYFVTSPVIADEYVYEAVKAGRYHYVDSQATVEQKDLLSIPVTVSLVNGITTVGDALVHVLQRSGYRLDPNPRVLREMSVLLSLPLPEAHKKLGPLPIYEILNVLAGDAWQLVRDDTQRFISFTDVQTHNVRDDLLLPLNTDYLADLQTLTTNSKKTSR